MERNKKQEARKPETQEGRKQGGRPRSQDKKQETRESKRTQQARARSQHKKQEAREARDDKKQQEARGKKRKDRKQVIKMEKAKAIETTFGPRSNDTSGLHFHWVWNWRCPHF